MIRNTRRLGVRALVVTATVGAIIIGGTQAADAATTATVRTDGGPLNIRAGASTSAAVAGQVRSGSTVSLACQSAGQWINGTVRATSQWDRLTNRTWVSHAYIQTSAPLPSCAAVDAPVPPSGAVARTDGGPLNVRALPAAGSALVTTAANGAALSLACQVSGQAITGTMGSTSQWDRLTSGSYVSHAYVQTATVLPSCTAATPTPAPAPSPTPTTPSPVAVAASAKTEGGPLNVRTAPSANATAAGQIANGGSLTVTCAVAGDYITGAVRSSSQWDRLDSGNYVSHAYVQTSASLPVCDGGAPVSGGTGPVGSMTNAQFITAAVAPAQQGSREFGVPASVTIAQAILESGWGRSALTNNDRNYFGIKCFSGSPGPIANGCHTYATYECTPTCYATYASFRTYASITDSFRDHGSFLTANSRYQPAFAYTHDANQFLYQIWKAGYATDPAYVSKVQALMSTYNLYQYDLS